MYWSTSGSTGVLQRYTSAPNFEGGRVQSKKETAWGRDLSGRANISSRPQHPVLVLTVQRECLHHHRNSDAESTLPRTTLGAKPRVVRTFFWLRFTPSLLLSPPRSSFFTRSLTVSRCRRRMKPAFCLFRLRLQLDGLMRSGRLDLIKGIKVWENGQAGIVRRCCCF